MRAKRTLKESLSHIEHLERQDAKKTEFFLAASHQLKSPVAIMQWCLQSMLEDQTLRAKDKAMVDRSLTQANAMSRLITDMLHVFKLVGRRDAKEGWVPVDVNKLLNEVLVRYEMPAQNRHIHLEKGPIEESLKVLGVEGYIREAIINLVDNAIKYTPEGRHVTVSAIVTKAKMVEIKVSDQGIGLTEADQEKLFSEFYRSPEAQAMTHEGTGLGLVLVKHIAEEFGGEILVDSAANKGSTFYLRFPAVN